MNINIVSKFIAETCWQSICLPFGDQYTSGNGIATAISDAYVFVVAFGVFVAVCVLVYAGFTYTTAGGDSDKVEQAQGLIKSGVIGLILLFLSKVIIDYVLSLVIL